MGTKQEVKEYIKEKTKNYYIVASEHYNQITPGDRICYIGTDKKFRLGGYVWYKKETDKGPFWMIGARSTPSFEPNVFRFALYWDKIKVLWKFMGVDTELLRESIDKKQEYITDVCLFLKKKFGNEFVEFMKKKESERLKQKVK